MGVSSGPLLSVCTLSISPRTLGCCSSPPKLALVRRFGSKSLLRGLKSARARCRKHIFKAKSQWLPLLRHLQGLPCGSNFQSVVAKMGGLNYNGSCPVTDGFVWARVGLRARTFMLVAQIGSEFSCSVKSRTKSKATCARMPLIDVFWTPSAVFERVCPFVLECDPPCQ